LGPWAASASAEMGQYQRLICPAGPCAERHAGQVNYRCLGLTPREGRIGLQLDRLIGWHGEPIPRRAGPGNEASQPPRTRHALDVLLGGARPARAMTSRSRHISPFPIAGSHVAVFLALIASEAWRTLLGTRTRLFRSRAPPEIQEKRT
jgi:hypothetical protein